MRTLPSLLLLVAAAAVCRGAGSHGRDDPPLHVHVTHGGLDEEDGTNPLHAARFVHNKEHIQEHIKHEDYRIDLLRASDEELEFYFFKIHDADGDRLLDGVELMAAVGHGLDEQLGRVMAMDGLMEATRRDKLARIKANHVALVDKILKEDDKNNDGYLSYSEYASSTRAHKLIGRDLKSDLRRQKEEATAP